MGIAAVGANRLIAVAPIFFLLIVLFVNVNADHPKPVPLPDPLPQSIQDALDDVHRALEELQIEKNISAMAVSVSTSERVLFSRGYGRVNASDASSPPATARTRFRIGSVTKLFPVIGMYQLRDRGLLHVDQTIDEFVPGFAMINPFHAQRKPTLFNLATHTAGLPRDIPFNFFLESCANLTAAEVCARLSEYAYVAEVNGKPAYSNAGFSLLGSIVAQVANESSFAAYTRENILAPLGMSDTTLFFDEAAASETAVGFKNDGSAAPYISIGYESPSGSAFSTAEDLGKLGSLFLRNDVARGARADQILDGATIDEMLGTVTHITPDYSLAMGSPWENVYDPNITLWSHAKTGDILGFAAVLVVIRPYGVSLSILIAEDQFSTMYLGIIVSERLIPALDAYYAANQPAPALPPDPSRFAGSFALQSGSPLMNVEGNATIALVKDSANNTHMQVTVDAVCGLLGRVQEATNYEFKFNHTDGRIFFQVESDVMAKLHGNAGYIWFSADLSYWEWPSLFADSRFQRQ